MWYDLIATKNTPNKSGGILREEYYHKYWHFEKDNFYTL